jgi:hypothetical protein
MLQGLCSAQPVYDGCLLLRVLCCLLCCVQTQLTLVQATPAAATALVLLEFAPAQAATRETTAKLVSVLALQETPALL